MHLFCSHDSKFKHFPSNNQEKNIKEEQLVKITCLCLPRS